MTTADAPIHVRLPCLPLRPDSQAWVDDWFMQQWGLYLLRQEKGELVHDLLEACSISADGCSYRLQINKGRKFSDGTEVSAEDVRASLLQSKVWVPAGQSPRLKNVSRYRLEIILQKPVNDLLERLSQQECCIRSARNRAISGGLWFIRQRSDTTLELEINPHHPHADETFYRRALFDTLEKPLPDGPYFRLYPGTLSRLPQQSLEEYSWPLSTGLACFLYLKEDLPRARLRSMFHQFARLRTPWLRTPMMELFPRHSWTMELPFPEKDSGGPPLAIRAQTPDAVFAGKFADDLRAFADNSSICLDFRDDPKAAQWICIEENAKDDQDRVLRRALASIRPHLKAELVPLAQRIENEPDGPRRLRFYKEFFQKWLHDPRVIPAFHIPLIVHSNCLLPPQGGGLCLLADIGDRPHLQRSEDWRQLNLSALGSSVQMLAHDLKKPFAMMDGLLRLLEKAEDPDRLRQLARDYLPEVRQMTRSVQEMLSDILEVSVDRSVLTEAISLGNVLDQTLPLLQRPTRALHFAFDLQHERMLDADLFKIARVFANILNNAIQASPDDATISLRTRPQGEDMLEISIHNQGSFIPQEKRERIFSAFYSEAKRQGTGLGLAIAQKIVLNHRGRIWCESSKAEGTSFHFTLHAAFQKEVPVSGLAEKWNRWARGNNSGPQKSSGAHLLLVEDDPIFRDIWMSSAVPIISYPDPEAFLQATRAAPELLQQAVAIVTDGRFESSLMQGPELLLHLQSLNLTCPLYLCSHEEAGSSFARVHKEPEDIVSFAQGLFAKT